MKQLHLQDLFAAAIVAASMLLASVSPCAGSVKCVQVAPAWCLWQSDRTFGRTVVVPFTAYKHHLQKHIVKALQKKGVKAFPSLYNSALRLEFEPRSMDEILSCMRKEPKEQFKYLTLTPVIHQVWLYHKGKTAAANVDFSLYLRMPDFPDTPVPTKPTFGPSPKNGKRPSSDSLDNTTEQEKILGSELPRITVRPKIRNTPQKLTAEHYNKLIELLGKRIAELKRWKKLAKAIPQESRVINPLPSVCYAKFKEGELLRHFSQSDYAYFNPKPSGINTTNMEIHKSSLYVVKANQWTDHLTFPFSLTNRIPELLYAWVIPPDFTVHSVTATDVHIQHSASDVAHDVYTDKREMIVNLPGLQDSSLVTYALRFRSLAYYDSTRRKAISTGETKVHLARDFHLINTNDSTPWQVAVMTSADGPELEVRSAGMEIGRQAICYVAPNSNPILQNMRTYVVGSTPALLHNLRIHFLDGSPTPPPDVYEISTHHDYSYLRVSNVPSWDQLLGEARDSIFKVLGVSRKPLWFRRPPKRPKASTIVRRHCQRISDSLRYRHMSFSAHKMIPHSPDSVLKAKTGDCKDFSCLLIRDLARHRILAIPALVHTSWPESFFPQLPSNDAFDHMIVYLPQYGWWVDPTGYPAPPWVTPGYLTGQQALVLFRDTIKIENVESDVDSIYQSKSTYTFEPNGKDLSCSYEVVASYGRSARVRYYYPRVDSAKRFDFLFPADLILRRYTCKEESLQVRNLNDYSQRLVIRRNFTARNTVSKIGTTTIANLPEVPFFWYIQNLVSQAERKTAFRVANTFSATLCLNWRNVVPADWPDLPTSTTSNSHMSGKIVGMASYEIKVSMKKGVLSHNEFSELENGLVALREFFTTPLLMK